MKSFKEFKTESYSVLNENPGLIKQLNTAKDIARTVLNKGFTYGTSNAVYDIAKPKEKKTNHAWKHALSTAITFPKTTLNLATKAIKFGAAAGSTILGLDKFKGM